MFFFYLTVEEAEIAHLLLLQVSKMIAENEDAVADAIAWGVTKAIYFVTRRVLKDHVKGALKLSID